MYLCRNYRSRQIITLTWVVMHYVGAIVTVYHKDVKPQMVFFRLISVWCIRKNNDHGRLHFWFDKYKPYVISIFCMNKRLLKWFKFVLLNPTMPGAIKSTLQFSPLYSANALRLQNGYSNVGVPRSNAFSLWFTSLCFAMATHSLTSFIVVCFLSIYFHCFGNNAAHASFFSAKNFTPVRKTIIFFLYYHGRR